MPGSKLLILGATGPTGQAIVQRAIELGWQVTVYGRRTIPEHKENANIKVRSPPVFSVYMPRLLKL